MTRPAPVSEATRAKWRAHLGFIRFHGNRYLGERDRAFIAEVERALATGADLAFADSTRLGRLHGEIERRIG